MNKDKNHKRNKNCKKYAACMQAECQKNQCLKRAQEEKGLYFSFLRHSWKMNKTEKTVALFRGKHGTTLKYSFLLIQPKSIEYPVTHGIQLSTRIKTRERFLFPFI